MIKMTSNTRTLSYEKTERLAPKTAQPLFLVDLEAFERWTPHKIIQWAVETFGGSLAMTSSFQQQSLTLLHIVSTVAPRLPVFFLDTGYHFEQTIAFRTLVAEQFGLDVYDIRPEMSRKEQEAKYGTDLPSTNPDLCCYLNKVLPLQTAMRGYRAWITGIRRDQSPARANAPIVDIREDGICKIAPLATWTRDAVWRYIEFHQLPKHPLYQQGYKSIGCAPCTQPIQEGEDERAGRWPGRKKAECGLHTVFRIN
jgi:phosphoadenosine phosphosulfate reductase